jgi:hypothetical protein
MAYDRTKDVNRRVGYLAQADLLVIKDILLPRAKEIASTIEGDPQDAAAAAYEQARDEYRALNGDAPAALPSKKTR